jgi:hypothetical protein
MVSLLTFIYVISGLVLGFIADETCAIKPFNNLFPFNNMPFSFSFIMGLCHLFHNIYLRAMLKELIFIFGQLIILLCS